MMKTVQAGKVRKGQLILIEGKPRLVTKREKWSSTHCRVCHWGSPPHFMDSNKFEYWRLDQTLEIYDPDHGTAV
jgi:hypothetical protein